MDYWSAIATVFGTLVVAMASPGANVVAVSGTAIKAGRKAGVYVALGIVTGSFIWVSLSVYVLSTLLSLYPNLAAVIAILGGTYLIWLGAKALKFVYDSEGFRFIETDEVSSFKTDYLKGVLVQLSNAKVPLFWIAVLSVAIGANAPSWVAIVLVTGTVVISLIIHTSYACLFSIKTLRNLYERYGLAIEAFQGIAFCLLGVFLISSVF